MTQLELLKRSMDTAYQGYLGAQKEYHAALMAAYKWQPGTLLRNRRGQFGRVKYLFVKYNEVWPIVALYNKNGKEGARTSKYWACDWEQAEIVAGPPA